jgi:hypothetical protein
VTRIEYHPAARFDGSLNVSSDSVALEVVDRRGVHVQEEPVGGAVDRRVALQRVGRRE